MPAPVITVRAIAAGVNCARLTGYPQHQTPGSHPYDYRGKYLYTALCELVIRRDREKKLSRREADSDAKWLS